MTVTKRKVREARQKKPLIIFGILVGCLLIDAFLVMLAGAVFGPVAALIMLFVAVLWTIHSVIKANGQMQVMIDEAEDSIQSPQLTHSVATQLESLVRLRDQGVLTQAEFEAQKRLLL